MGNDQRENVQIIDNKGYILVAKIYFHVLRFNIQIQNKSVSNILLFNSCL